MNKTTQHNSPEMAALNDLLKTMNDPNIPGVFVPPGVDTTAVDKSGHVAPVPPRTGPDEIDKSSILYAPPGADTDVFADPHLDAIDKRFIPSPPPPDEPKDLSKDIKKLRAKERAAAKRAIAANGPDGVSGPPGDPGAVEVVAGPVGVSAPAGAPRGVVEVSKPTKSVGKKLFFTGRLKSGKDNAAAAAGATVFGFVDPIYALASHYFGVTINATEGKDLPGVRVFLQVVGNWGRGVISEAYPLTAPRAIFMQHIRHAGDFGFPDVDWATFGNNQGIWLDACIKRANRFSLENPTATVAITNCRFDNEFKKLQLFNWAHWHCMCSPKTWADRLALSKLTPESPAVKDLSEQLAASLDANVTRQLSAAKQGPKLRCIWSDKNVPAPSDRLHTVDSFLQSLKGAA